MKCPVCNVALTMSDRQGIEIDSCPQCRGVWLDRGELDKGLREVYFLFNRAKIGAESEHKREYEEKSKHHGYEHEYNHKHKKKSFLEEIFD